tara:strand:- start:1368 stop:2921 length:1554 start_codon:yes stop_codon:yes gene_type:complete
MPRNVYQELFAQVRSLKTENEQLKKNGATKKTYIKELFQMTIKNMKLTEAKTNLEKTIHDWDYHIDNRILDMEDEIADKEDAFLETVGRKCKIIEEQRKKIQNYEEQVKNLYKVNAEYEEQMKSLLNMVNDAPPAYETLGGVGKTDEPIVNNPTNNPIKIQSLVRGFLIRNKELMKCGVCYETKFECQKVKTKCCKNIICQKCFDTITTSNGNGNDRCPFCRNGVDFRQSIPVEWFNIVVQRGHRTKYKIGTFNIMGVFNGNIYIRNIKPNDEFNIPYENIPTQWKCKVGEYGWYGKYMSFAENMAIQQKNDIGYDHPNRMTYPVENNNPLTRMAYKTQNTVIIEGNSCGIFDMFKRIFKTPSHLTLTNPNEENLIEWADMRTNLWVMKIANRMGKSRGFDLDWYIAEIEENMVIDTQLNLFFNNYFTPTNTKGQTREAKWNRAFLRLLTDCAKYEECEGYTAIYMTLKYQRRVYVFVINIQHNQGIPREFTYYNYETLNNSFQNNMWSPRVWITDV